MKAIKDCYFVGSTKRDISKMPQDVKSSFGLSIFQAQEGAEAENVKALKGFAGRSILEIIENHDGDTYRAIYTVRYSTGIYVLHAFQKKSKSGIATPKQELDLVVSRLKDAEVLHQFNLKGSE
jgi:phage-related protein